MNIRTAIITATTAAVLATTGVALAGAASTSASNPPATTASANVSAPAPKTTADPAVAAHGRRIRPRIRRAIRRGALRIISEATGIDRKTLRQDLLAGQTIADIAQAHGVDPKTLEAKLVTAATTKLDAAATAGLITTAGAHRIEQRLTARVTKLVETWHPKKARATAP